MAKVARIFSDHSVQMLRAEKISAQADLLRERCGVYDQVDLDVVALVRRLEKTELPNKGRLTLDVCAERPGGYRAYVSFKPLTLHIERITFERARWNTDFESKYIICHELGHAILHDHNAKPFSTEELKYNRFGIEEISAEWQANCFADYLLLPSHILSRFTSIDEIVDVCNVNSSLATRRFATRRCANLFQSAYSGEFCPNCPNACLVRRGLLLECDNCGESSSGL